jgi:hypothetical protein
MFAQLVVGKFDFADICFFIAFVLFCVVFLLRVIATPRPVDGVLVAAGLAFVSLAFFVL